jgi:asparagine synthetase B (glutamine-hydrolysing)
MCEISGLYSTANSPETRILQQMEDSLDDRGRNESEYFQDGPIGLLHRWLRSTDLDTGCYQIFNECDTATLNSGNLYHTRPAGTPESDVNHDVLNQ